MKLFPICLMCSMLLFGFANSKNQSINLNFDDFVEGILDIRKFYAAATVIFAHPGEYGAYGGLAKYLTIMHLVHSCSKLLHKHHVMTLNVHFKKMWRSLRYRNRIVQPIVVAIIPTFEAFLEFQEATKTYPMSFPSWFVLFLFTLGNDTHDHCHYPIGNPFNLRFDTQMLVLCHNASILREWYSVNGKTTKIFDIAKWENDRFIPLTTLSLYDRRKDLNGTVLRTVTIKDMPMSRKYAGKAENFIAKLFEKVVEELTQSLNFTLDIVSDMEDHGAWNHENKTWSGVMGEIVSGRADIAFAVMSLTSLRVRDVDFTFPLIISKVSLFFKEPEMCDVKWFSYFQTFHIYTWAAIITVIVITSILLYLMTLYCTCQNRSDDLSDKFLYIWGIFCQQGLLEFPKCSSIRIAYFTIFLMAVLIMAHYSAALVSFLTSCTPALPFRTMDEFLKDGTYKLVVQRAGYNMFVTSNESSKQMMKVMTTHNDLITSLLDGFMQICNEKVAYLVLNTLEESLETKIPCKVSSISMETVDNLGMILSKDNPYTGVINYHLQKFLDNGMIMRLKNMRFFMHTNENKAYEPVYVVNVIPILAILCGGMILGVIILIIEVMYYVLIHGK